MPRISPSMAVRTKQERQALDSVACKSTSPPCDVIRARTVFLAGEGLSKNTGTLS
jgi:hypothetical protein